MQDEVDTLKAKLAQAQYHLDHTRIVGPSDGYVVKRKFKGEDPDRPLVRFWLRPAGAHVPSKTPSPASVIPGMAQASLSTRAMPVKRVSPSPALS